MSDELPPTDPREMFQHLPFPFKDGRFPQQLGAVVQTTVIDSKEPARLVIHTSDNSWIVGDGVNDPNLPDAAIAFHIHHVLQADPSLHVLAGLPLGHIATRDGPGRPWSTDKHEWPDEP
jgi:hypothetical protein